MRSTRRLSCSGALLLAAITALPAAAETEPEFVYQTTHNVSFLDSGRDLAVDADGNAYVLAYGYETNGDVIVFKLGPSGTVLWTTYLAGSGLDVPGGIAVDSNGDVYVVGRTLSEDFPIVNAMQPVMNGPGDAFISKLASADGSLIFSTYYGGSRHERGNDIVVNDAGEIYFVGATDSRDIPVVNPLQEEINDYNGLLYDAYVAKISADGQSVLYGTYLGGSFRDYGRGIGIDDAANIYICGHTESEDWPVENAVQPFYGGGFHDVFATRISADGSTLEYSTFLGGEDWEIFGSMEVDAGGHVYLAGSTRSQFYPTTPGAFQEQFVGEIDGCGQPPFDPIHNCEDMFVTKLLPDGGFGFSTFVAGHEVDEARAVAVGRDGAVYAVGYTYSDDFPLTDGQGNVVVSKLNASGSDLVYTVELFSGSPNAGHGMAVGPDGDVYFTGAINVPADVYVARLDEGPAGDLNGDGCVDQADLGILLAAFGVDEGGDLDGDNDTDQADLGILLANWGVGCDDTVTLALQLDGLEDLGPDYVYEGWLIVAGMPVSTGRFAIDENGMPVPGEFEVNAADAASASLFVLTIEPAEGDDPAPADTHMLAGAWDGVSALLTIGHPAALGDDFTSAAGEFILETPSTGDIPEDYDQGIWWLDPAGGPGPSLVLPELPPGWEYEGWVVGDDGPITTGRFLSVSGADSDGAGPNAGPDPAPPFPGQDYIDPPMVLTGFAAVITIEPEPDNSPDPFTLKPLIDGNIEDVGPGVLQSMENRAADAPIGIAGLVD